MGFTDISKILIITAIPFLIFLIAANFIAFDESFYQREFSKHKVNENVEGAQRLHEQVVDFLQGKGNELPAAFNEREKQHLLDVRNVINALTISLYALIILFIFLIVLSSIILKTGSCIINFVGKALFFGGLLTIILAAMLFFSISLGFSSAFESFHQIFFSDGTYTFDPANEIIVNLYPEDIFMDLGLKISKWAVFSAIMLALAGWPLILKSKSKKNKNR